MMFQLVIYVGDEKCFPSTFEKLNLTGSAGRKEARNQVVIFSSVY